MFSLRNNITFLNYLLYPLLSGALNVTMFFLLDCIQITISVVLVT